MQISTTPWRRFAGRPLGFLIAITLVSSWIVCCSDTGAPATPARTDRPDNRPAEIWQGRSFAFTFTSDDGNADNLAWTDVYREFGLRYTLFITARWVGRPGKLTVQDLRRLQSDGFEIGGHSLSHPRLTDCSDSARIYEMVVCRDTLEVMIDSKDYRCLTFAYPENAHNDRVMATAGLFYTAARDGGTHPNGQPNFSEGRAEWDSCSLYEVPVAVTMSNLTGRNSFSEEKTRGAIRSRLADYRKRHCWVVVATHKLVDCDADHMRWILEELRAAADVWIAPFSEVAACYRRKIGLPPYSISVTPRRPD